MHRSARPLALACGALLALSLLPTAPAGAAPPAAPTSSSRAVIVLLRDQHRNIPNTRAKQALRTRTLRADQRPVVARASRLGASRVHQFASVNAVAMTLDTAKQQALAADPAVKAIVPDLPIKLPQRAREQAVTAAATTPKRVGTTCPKDSAQPLHEPEALQAMSVQSTSGSGGAHAITRGAGVKVAYIADGLDPQQPDFLRNGKSVFVDYQDFTNDGAGAPTSGAEAFGDASSIAAQGNQTYDLADFVNQAQALPKGCTIKVVGVAPDADLVGLKVFGQDTAPTSRFVQAIEYAVNVDHVDVLNESFGQNPYADTADDPVSLANTFAVSAGTTVVTSTGDAGVNGTIGSPASAKDVIAVAATNDLRSYAQTNYGYINLPGVTGYASDDISALSSSGFAQNGKVPDLVAPGDSGWALCSPDVKRYTDCRDFGDARAGSPIQLFGGTSQSSPLTAGAAALVIAAYRTGHPGAPDPSPALVKRILTSTARDLGHPAELQGAGEVNARSAVKAALSVPTEGTTTTPASARGAALLVDHGQLDLDGRPGSTATESLRVTNLSDKTRKLSADVRALTTTKGSGQGTITFAPSRLPRVVSAFGDELAYTSTPIKVGKGVDRLEFSAAYTSDRYYVRAVLVDPKGGYRTYSLPEGFSNYARVDARAPATGTWTAYLIAESGFSGQVHYGYTLRAYSARGAATVSPQSVAPGETSTVTLKVPLPDEPGDLGASVQLTGTAGDVSRASVPLSLRAALAPEAGRTVSFAGTITGGNGRDPLAQQHSYYVDMPAGAPSLSVGVKLTGQKAAGEAIEGILVSPQGQPLSAASNSEQVGDEVTLAARLQLYVRKPAAGRWHLVLQTDNPVAGTLVEQPFTATVGLTSVSVHATPRLPLSTSTVLKAGTTTSVSIKVTNTGVATRTFFADPRLSRTKVYTLASQTPGDDQQEDDLLAFDYASWLVPPRSRELTFTATGNQPLELDAGWYYLDPEIYGRASGSSATASIFTDRIANGLWYAQAGPIGPFTTTPATPGTVAYTAKVRAQQFDPRVTTSTGDYWQSVLVQADGDADQRQAAAVRPRGTSAPTRAWNAASRMSTQAAAAAAVRTGPLVLAPGKSGTILVQITPLAADKGKVIKGALDIDTVDSSLGTGDEVAKYSYLYTVG